MLVFSVNSEVVKTKNNEAINETKVVNDIIIQAPKTAAGREGIPSEAWWYIEDLITDTLLKILNQIWNNKKTVKCGAMALM